ncbi:MAG: hypothetical protein EBZ69_02945 [Alphaproteobacteria bacterium]|nr:hypothetical protein [Alphaproteobacteria bacterium]NDC55758.1 hypothetical protein [Alphaproteobacteria bacterium]NDG03930.1 hypothetical protein [Alphaproteobacteria bacterium]
MHFRTLFVFATAAKVMALAGCAGLHGPLQPGMGDPEYRMVTLADLQHLPPAPIEFRPANKKPKLPAMMLGSIGECAEALLNSRSATGACIGPDGRHVILVDGQLLQKRLSAFER